MLSSIDLYYSPTAASSRLAARLPPSASSMKVTLRSPSPSSSKIVLPAPARPTSQIPHSPSPSPSSKTEEDSASSRGKGKRLRRAQACDICRKSSPPPFACFELYVFTNLSLLSTVSLSVGGNHRKCNGPIRGSTSCGRCITQHKICTWNFSKERSTRQRSASVSSKTIRMHIKQSKSAKPAPSKGTSPSASSSSCSGSSETCSPNTPSDRSQRLRLPLLEYGQRIAQNAGTAFTYNPALQCEQPLPRKEKELIPARQDLPQFHAECIALANKYNLLIYTLPLTPWDESRPSEAIVRSRRGLWCTIPSCIQPAPSRKEAADVLRALLEAEGEVESDVEFGVPTLTAPPALPAVMSGMQVSDDGGELSDDEQMAQRGLASGSSADYDSDKDSITEPVPAQNGMAINMDLEENASFEREPESCSAPPGTSHLNCQFPLQHPEQQSMDSGFDAFLITCHCFSNPPQASPETPASSIMNSISDHSRSEKKKELDAFWNEGIPDVLQEASDQKALQECLQFLTE
ncbi:uncharacterized protein UDID_06633 [Ustilago sp. UG-2017a]|nr:uncharacterized protein UDID_06633 [Ustilago sp. UG-2017a]